MAAAPSLFLFLIYPQCMDNFFGLLAPPAVNTGDNVQNDRENHTIVVDYFVEFVDKTGDVINRRVFGESEDSLCMVINPDFVYDDA